MTNLEKLTAGEVAARNNGTLEQLREVIGHCFPNKPLPDGNNTLYYKSYNSPMWVSWHTCKLPTIPITQLWEELQALKKPEIWWIRVTEDNKEVLGKWFGSLNLHLDNIVGMYRLPNGNIHKGCILIKNLESETYDFGNEIDFATFLKYTGVEVEKGEKCTCETCNPTEPKKVEKSLEDKISELTQLINKRVELNIKSDRFVMVLYLIIYFKG